MAAASDKARFYLEQSIPELKEYERKGIFSPEEITSIARKRSDFEHKINARGSTPLDYARYAEFEINVDALRRKRVKRLGIKSTAHSGKRRIFFVFDRGTRKHPGDVGLWEEAINFAKKQKAYKKLQEIYTQVLRLHPTKSSLWIDAAHHATEENGDMTEARSYMQRGLRFCKGSKALWLEYGRLEVSYMAKIHARRDVLGIHGDKKEQASADKDMLPLTHLTAEDVNPQGEGHEVNTSSLEALEATPATTGAIPIAVFDAAMSQFDDCRFGLDFFEMLLDYNDIPACRNVASHVESVLTTKYPDNWCSQLCHIRIPVVAITPLAPGFPAAFRQVISRLKRARTTNNPELFERVRVWLEQLVNTDDLDPAIKLVGESVIRTLGAAESTT